MPFSIPSSCCTWKLTGSGCKKKVLQSDVFFFKYSGFELFLNFSEKYIVTPSTFLNSQPIRSQVEGQAEKGRKKNKHGRQSVWLVSENEDMIYRRGILIMFNGVALCSILHPCVGKIAFTFNKDITGEHSKLCINVINIEFDPIKFHQTLI